MSEKKTWILTIVGGFLLALGLGAMIYFQQEEIDEAHEQAASLRDEISDGRTLVEGTHELEREVIIQRETDEAIKQILPNEADINTFVKTLQSFGEKSGVLISQIKGKKSGSKKKGKQDFAEHGYTLSFRADAFQLLTFLNQVETHERFMSVPSFKLSGAKRKSSNNGEASLHQLTMDVVTYVYKPKQGAKSLKIDNYDRKRDLLLAEIAERRSNLQSQAYEYRGARSRRDPWIDPRVPVSGDGGLLLSVEDQIALVDELVTKAEDIEELWGTFEEADNLIAEMKARKSLVEALSPLEDEIRRVQDEGQVQFVSAQRRFQTDVVEVLEDVRAKLEDSGAGAGPSVADLQESLDTMTRHLEAGEYEHALAAFEAIEPKLYMAEVDDQRRALVNELRRLERLPRTVLEFEQIALDIRGVIVEEGRSAALINGVSVSPGEMLDSGLIVSAIQANEIEFLFRGVALVRRIEEQ